MNHVVAEGGGDSEPEAVEEFLMQQQERLWSAGTPPPMRNSSTSCFRLNICRTLDSFGSDERSSGSA